MPISYIHPTRPSNAMERAAAIARHPAGKSFRKDNDPWGGYVDRFTGERVNVIRYPAVNTLGLFGF